MLPRYRRIVAFLRERGVRAVILDCDGHIGDIASIWIEAGMDGTFPCEIAAANDPLAYRRLYGDKLSLWGCIDKRAIGTRQQTYDEVMGTVPALMASGGFLPSVDHAVPPTVPLRSYLYMCELIKALAEGRPVPAPDAPLPLEEKLGPVERMWGPDMESGGD
jgi:uroporphyrinogen decarboxylase